MAKVLITEEYLQAMADAIREKSSTSDPITPAGMAQAIEEIPSGPEPTPTPVDPADPVDTPYGAVLYWPTSKPGWFVNTYSGGTRGCLVNSIDTEKLDNFITAFPPAWGNAGEFSIEYRSSEQAWSYYYNSLSGESTELLIPDQSFEPMTGINATVTDTSGSGMVEMHLYRGLVPDETVQTQFITLTSQASLDALAQRSNQYASDWTYTVEGVTIPKECIKRFVFGQNKNIPVAFLSGSGIRTISNIPAGTVIGYNRQQVYEGDFLSNCQSFNSPIVIEGNAQLGAEFLAYSQKFNSPITFPAVAQVTIDREFLCGCVSFDQDVNFRSVQSIGNNCLMETAISDKTITFPSTISSIDEACGRGCSNFVGTIVCEVQPSVVVISQGDDTFFTVDEWIGGPIATTGFAFSGTYKNEWASTFPTIEGKRKVRVA